MINKPMFTSVICSGIFKPAAFTQPPIGITAIDVSASESASIGASRYSGLFT